MRGRLTLFQIGLTHSNPIYSSSPEPGKCFYIITEKGNKKSNNENETITDLKFPNNNKYSEVKDFCLK